MNTDPPDTDSKPWNPFTDPAAQTARDRAAERIFPSPSEPEPEPSAEDRGDGEGGNPD